MGNYQDHHQPCPCGVSSDAFSPIYNYCFSCANEKNPERGSYVQNQPIPVRPSKDAERPLLPQQTTFKAIPERGLTEEACARFGAWVADNGNIIFPRFSGGKHVGNKIRSPKKEFWFQGSAKGLDLVGQHAFSPGSAKALTITEGHEDAVAAFQMMGHKYPCVSVDSSSQAAADIKRNFEYVDSFESVVLCFDNDEPGNDAVRKVCALGFKPGKIKVLRLRDGKDASDYSIAKKAEAFTKEWWQAPTYKPDGLILGTELLESIIHRPNHFQIPYPYHGMNKMTYGIRLSEMMVINAPTGIGKTSLVKEIEYSILMNPDVIKEGYGVGFLHLEEPNGDTALGMCSIHNSQPYHLPDCDKPEADLKAAFEAVLNTNRVVIWDHFGSNSVDAVVDKVRHMHALGCKYIVVDHLSIIVSDQAGDERKQLDEITTKLKTLCMNLNIALICVIHQNRQGEIRGTAGVEQMANIVIKLDRDITDANEWRRNVMKITVTKNRFCGRCGPATYLWYNERTGRLEELTPEQGQMYEAGGSLNDDMPFSP